MRVVRRGLGWALGLILAVGLGASPFAASAQSPPPSTGEPAADGGGPIPLAEVAARAAEIHSLLETQDTAISPSRSRVPREPPTPVRVTDGVSQVGVHLFAGTYVRETRLDRLHEALDPMTGTPMIGEPS